MFIRASSCIQKMVGHVRPLKDTCKCNCKVFVGPISSRSCMKKHTNKTKKSDMQRPILYPTTKVQVHIPYWVPISIHMDNRYICIRKPLQLVTLLYAFHLLTLNPCRLKLPGRGWTRAFQLAVPTKDIQMACSKSSSNSDFNGSQPFFWEKKCNHFLMSKKFNFGNGLFFVCCIDVHFLKLSCLSFSCLSSVNTYIASLVGS